MRVAQVIGCFEKGGAQRQAYNLVLGLGALGIDARGIAVRQVGDYVRWNAQESTFLELGAYKSNVLTVLRAGLRMRRLVERWRPHVLHVQGTDSLPFVHFCLRGLRWQPVTFFTWQDSSQVLHQRGRAKRRMVRALAACTGVFGSSADVARLLAGAIGRSDVGIFHGGVDEAPAARPTHPPLILWVGRCVPDKAPDKLVQAAALLKKAGRPFRAVLVGGAHAGSSYLEDLRATVRQAGLESLVSLPGYVPDSELASLYQQASIGVQTSLTEGLSMVLLEQMMRGLAIVATEVGDTAVALDAGRCGLLVPRDCTPEQLAGQLSLLLADPVRRHQLGQDARERALTHFSIHAMAENARSIYERSLRAPAPQHP